MCEIKLKNILNLKGIIYKNATTKFFFSLNKLKASIIFFKSNNSLGKKVDTILSI